MINRNDCTERTLLAEGRVPGGGIWKNRGGLQEHHWNDPEGEQNVNKLLRHYGGVIMGEIASQITSPAIVYSTVYSDADQRKD